MIFRCDAPVPNSRGGFACFAGSSDTPGSDSPAVECGPTLECPGGFNCVDGVCREVCQVTLNCGPNLFCEAGSCIPVTTTNCAQSDDCNPGWFCSGGQCDKRRDAGLGCSSNDACASDVCRGNICCSGTCEGPCRECTKKTDTDPGGECLTASRGEDPNDECPYGCTDANACQALGTECDDEGQCGTAACTAGLCCVPIVFETTEQVFVRENASDVLTLSILTDDPTPVHYSLREEGDFQRFSLNPSGELAFLQPADFESPDDLDADGIYEIALQAELESGCSETINVDVVVTDESLLDIEVIYPYVRGNLGGAAQTTVRGRLRDLEDGVLLDTDVASLTVNEVPATLTSSKWIATVDVTAPVAELRVRAVSSSEDSDEVTLTLENRLLLRGLLEPSYDASRDRVIAHRTTQALSIPLDGSPAAVLDWSNEADGPTVGDIRSLSVPEGSNHAYVCEKGPNPSPVRLLRVNLSTGERTLLSGTERGTGPPLFCQVLAVDETSGFVYSFGSDDFFGLDGAVPLSGSQRIEISTGNRSYFGAALGRRIQNSSLDELNARLLVVGDNDIRSVDLESGSVSDVLVSPFFTQDVVAVEGNVFASDGVETIRVVGPTQIEVISSSLVGSGAADHRFRELFELREGLIGGLTRFDGLGPIPEFAILTLAPATGLRTGTVPSSITYQRLRTPAFLNEARTQITLDGSNSPTTIHLETGEILPQQTSSRFTCAVEENSSLYMLSNGFARRESVDDVTEFSMSQARSPCALIPPNSRLAVASGPQSIDEVDFSSESFREISGPTTGGGTPFAGFIKALAATETNVFVVTSESTYSVDIATGDRTVVDVGTENSAVFISDDGMTVASISFENELVVKRRSAGSTEVFPLTTPRPRYTILPGFLAENVVVAITNGFDVRLIDLTTGQNMIILH